MDAQYLLADSIIVDQEMLDPTSDSIHLYAHLAVAQPVCPDCRQLSARVHSQYMRTITDLPWARMKVLLFLTVRRFFCSNSTCARRTFTEQVPAVIAPYARRTERLKAAQRELAFASGGEAAARTAEEIGLKTSPDSFLRLIRTAPDPTVATPRVLGVDDWAFRKRHRYGTILIDLEHSKPIDLLPNREPETVAKWLRAHPGVEIVTRDRASAYAEGITQGAPQALQVADRWHLLQNVGDATERFLDRQHSALRQIQTESSQPPSPLSRESIGNSPVAPAKVTRGQRLIAEHRARRLTKFQEMKALQAQGLSQRAISRKLHLHRRTVRRYLNADEFPERAARLPQANPLDPFQSYLQERWKADVRDYVQLYHELRDLGYAGSKTRVRDWASEQRRSTAIDPRTSTDASPTPRGKRRPGISARRVAWLLVRPSNELTSEEQDLLTQLKSHCLAANLAHELVQAFSTIVRERNAGALKDWLQAAKTSGLLEYRTLAVGLERDWEAVRAALSFPWSNGPTEGHVHRLKLIKRQMYGRAKFDLLRRRVLHGY